MPTREEQLIAADTGLRGTIPEPTDLKAFLPGAPMPFLVPTTTPMGAEITSEIDQLQSDTGELVGKVIEEYSVPLRELLTGTEEIRSKIIGGIGNDVDAMEMQRSKIAAKVQSNISNGMREIYAGMNDMGLPTPTLDQVKYGNASRDFVGSLFPPEDTQAKSQVGADPRAISVPGYGQGDGQGQVNAWLDPVTSANVGVGSKPTSTTNQAWIPPATAQTTMPAACLPGRGRAMPFTREDIIVDGWVEDWSGVASIEHCGFTLTTPVSEQSLATAGCISGWRAVCLHEREFWTLRSKNMSTLGTLAFCVPDNNFLVVDERNGRLWAASEIPPGFIAPYGQRVCGGGTDDQVVPPVAPPVAPPADIPVQIPPADMPEPVGKCAATPVLSCVPEVARTPKLTAAGDDACTQFAKNIQDITTGNVDFLNLIGMASSGEKPDGVTAKIISAITGSPGQAMPELLARLRKWMKSTIESCALSVDCNPAQIVPIAIWQGALKIVDKWLDIIPDQALKVAEQASNTVCQANILSQSEADNAYMANEIDKDLWECLTKANGNILSLYRKSWEAGRTKLSPDQYVALMRRKYITQEQYFVRMREAGVISAADIKNFEQYSDQWPQISDIIRMMTRDVADEDAVIDNKLDTDFDRKFAGRVAEYAEAAGIRKDIALDYWRAHWDYPSYTQVTEMYHRLRPGHVAPEVEVDRKKFVDLLKINDMAPEWVERLIAIGYHPINSSDAVKRFMIHEGSELELYNNYLDHGYEADDSNTMTNYHKRQREINDIRASGFPTMRALMRAYANCEITRGTVESYASKIVVSDEQLQYALEAADATKFIANRKRIIKGTMSPYMKGLIDEGTAIQRLSEAGIDSDCIPDLIRGWEQRKAKSDKHMSASQLCDMRDKGIIDYSEQILALVRSGWTGADASRIANSCETKLTEKQIKAAERAAQKAERERVKAEKAAKKAQREAECGPPPCPKNRQIDSPASEDGQ